MGKHFISDFSQIKKAALSTSAFQYFCFYSLNTRHCFYKDVVLPLSLSYPLTREDFVITMHTLKDSLDFIFFKL